MTTLLACSAGGHLKQLHRLLPRFELDDDIIWITFDTGLSRSLLEDQEVIYAEYAAPRQFAPLARSAKKLHPLVKERKIDRVISTGSGLALASFPEVLLRRGECHYIESAARVLGPSMTGKVVQRMPGVRRYTQYPTWASEKWHYGGSVYDGFHPVQQDVHTQVNKVVVSVGTTESYGFRRLIERLAQIIPSDVEVLWQTGATDVTGLNIDARESVPAAELTQAIAEADVVVSHAGNGAAISSLEAGMYPVMVPRRAGYNEHIDDHQVQIAHELAARDLAVAVEADAVSFSDLEKAAGRRTELDDDPPPFLLLD